MYETSSTLSSEDDESLNELEIMTLMNERVNNEKIIESKKIISVLLSLTELEKALLY